MTPDGIRERFELYRKWFRTFLVREFLNLPAKYQERFMALLTQFVEDCKRIKEEHKQIKEKTIKVIIERVETPDNKEEDFIAYGKHEESDDEIRLRFPVSKPRPKIGKRVRHVVYSTDESVWYSSKEELITGRKK